MFQSSLSSSVGTGKMKTRSGINPNISSICPGNVPVVVDEILRNGLAAELAAALPLIPAQAYFDIEDEKTGVWWRSDFVIPHEIDPQHPEPYYHLLEALDHEIPRKLNSSFRRKKEGLISLAILRKGSWLDVPDPEPGDYWFYLVISGGNWPLDWGGHIKWEGGTEALTRNRLLLIPHAHSISVLEHHVESILLFGQLLVVP